MALHERREVLRNALGLRTIKHTIDDLHRKIASVFPLLPHTPELAWRPYGSITRVKAVRREQQLRGIEKCRHAFTRLLVPDLLAHALIG